MEPRLIIRKIEDRYCMGADPRCTSLPNLTEDYYRNNSVMHSSVPDECKPVLLHKNNRVAFPLPTKTIKVPKKVGRARV